MPRWHQRRETRRKLTDWVFILPQFGLFTSLHILPFILAIPLLFTDMSSFVDTNVKYIGTANFTRIFVDPDLSAQYWPALGRTLRFTGLNYLAV
jgi:raffinose/stachyose/melibiose transport system permease protein